MLQPVARIKQHEMQAASFQVLMVGFLPHLAGMEHGPALDAAWAAGRRDGRIPTFPLEDRQALLTGDTFPVKDAIKGLCGKWRPEQKGWVVPAFGENYCDRRNFDYVQRFQESLEALANRGITITYQTP